MIGKQRKVNISLSIKCIRVSVEGDLSWRWDRMHTCTYNTHTITRSTGCYAVEIPEVDFPSPPASWDWEQGGGGVKLASGRLLPRDGMEDGDGGSRVLLGLSMSPSPTRVRSVWTSSSTVRRLVRVSVGREMGDRWVPKAGWRGGGNRHRLECPLALELREESRLSERRLEVRAPRVETPFSRVCFRESGVEQARPGGVRRRKSGSTRSSLFRSPRWSLARVLCARLSSSKNSAGQIKHVPSLNFPKRRQLGERGLVWFNMQQSSLAPDRQNNPAELPKIAVSPGAKQSSEIHHESKRQREKEKGDLPSASSILIFFCFLFSPGSAESGPLALTEKSFGVDLSSPCRCNNNNALC